ncbi:lipase maturation factor, putative [Plasmodium gallinaceum]|uniref:Lipase maturation factor 2 n=1 Tax=Plasmodium gallinaceum TaxID=5849 RepID=A0A1J1GM52_PLAGA|nr:lipase maturation factor, putative [Plasmodium gallinaceum]CRG93473.1 lipase maturation factor, putative [Plasmodium gallinaceum]
MDTYNSFNSKVDSYNFNEKNEKKYKLTRKNCYIITCFIIYIFFLSTINNLYKYLHLKISHCILTFSNILYFISFYSLNIQVELLIGVKDGILPVDKYLKEIKKKLKSIDFFLVHQLIYFVYKFWKYIIINNIKVHYICKIGIFLSILNFLIQTNIQNDIFRIFLSFYLFVLLFFFHLCFKIVMRDFMIFQCDLLMNEFGFILIFLNLSDSYYLRYSNTLIICVLRLIAFKIIFNSAVHKFVYNSTQWLHLEAFQNLFSSQPIPSALSHIANCKSNKKLICLLIIISEFLFSWFLFGSSNLRIFFFIIFISIHLTCYIICNYFFFSYICLILFFSSFDDSFFNLFSNSRDVPTLYKFNVFVNILIFSLVCLITIIIFLFYMFIVFINFVPFFEKWDIHNLKCFHFFYYIYYKISPINICNSYAMLIYNNNNRKEIVIEELHKIEEFYEWKEIYFKYKPSDINRIGGSLWWGHIPRLEWKLFFFSNQYKKDSLRRKLYPIYICSFLKKLCYRDKILISMFNKIMDKQMNEIPVFIRIILYDYKMTKQEIKNDLDKNDSKIKDEIKWEFGKYWIRRKINIIETLKYKKKNF